MAAAALLAVGSAAHAQEALYPKQPPPGAAFVRFVNATALPLEVGGDVQPVSLGVDAGQRIGRYRVIADPASRPLRLTAGGAGFTYQPQPGSSATLVFRTGGDGALRMAAVADQADFNQARARLVFYNLDAACPAASLLLDGSGKTVFDAVGEDESRARAVNPVQASVRADCGGQSTPALALSPMEIGQSYSIWFFGAATPLVMTRDATAPADATP